MANTLYPLAREGFLIGEIDAEAVLKVSATRSGAYNAAHKFVSDLTSAGGVLHGSAVTLASKTYTGGTLDAADIVFTALAANATGHTLLLYQASAVGGGADVAATAQRLIAWIDTGTNIPFTPNGGDVTVAFDNGANKIFTL